MGPIIDAIWQLPWYQILIVAIADDAILIMKVWPLWVLIAVIIGLRFAYTWWDYKWGVKRRRKKKLKKAKATYEDHGTYIKRPERPDKSR